MDSLSFPTEGDDEDAGMQAKRQKAENKRKSKGGGFQTMGLSDNVYRGIVKKGYQLPTPIQRKTIPLIMDGKDVVAMARTGSGKTAAFVLPMLNQLEEHATTVGVRAIVLSPTRELAIQTSGFVRELGKYLNLRTCVLIGGDSIEAQFAALADNPDILIATPGRLMHQLVETGMSIRTVQYVVFDEADRLFEMGFAEQLREVLHRLSDRRQTLLFSATMPAMLAEFARAGLKDPELVRLDVETKLSESLSLSFLSLREEEKLPMLLYLIRQVLGAEEQTIVFAATKHHVEYINYILTANNLPTTFIYGDLDPTARKINLAKFRSGACKVLVVTDVAARGIDVPLLNNVVNYDFPPKGKLFVHRAGRAARAGRTGTCYTFATQEEMGYYTDVCLFLGVPVYGGHLRTAAGTVTIGSANDNGGRDAGTDVDGSGLYKGAGSKLPVIGKVGQTLMDAELEGIRKLIFASPELNGMKKAMGNAHKLYCKTRPAAAPESIRRAKKLYPAIKLHPMFYVSDADAERVAMLEAMHAFTPTLTIFETKQYNAHKGGGALGSKTGGSGRIREDNNEAKKIMATKRSLHDKVVRTVLRKEAVEAAVDQEESFRVSTLAAAKAAGQREGRAEDSSDDGGDDSSDEDGAGPVIRDGSEAASKKGGGKAKKRKRAADRTVPHYTDDSGDDDDDDDDAVGYTLPNLSKSAPSAAQKRAPQLSKRAKKAIATGVAPSASALAAKRLAALQGAPGANDAEFFVPNTPGATGSEPFGGGGDGSGNGKDPKANEIMYAATERGLSIGDESGRSFGQNRMESAQLDLTHDEAKALYREKKNNLVWDRKKKNFVNTDGLKANDNRLSAKEGGLGRGLGKKKKKEASGLYEKWQAKTKTRIQLPGEGESRNKKVSVMADRGYGLGAARGGRDKWKSGAAVAAQKQTSGGSWKGAAGADGGHNLTKKVSGRRVDKTVTGSGGGVGGSELRDKDQIRKARVSVEKNKLKQMSKKNRGNALKAKGIKGGKEKGHFEAYR